MTSAQLPPDRADALNEAMGAAVHIVDLLTRFEDAVTVPELREELVTSVNILRRYLGLGELEEIETKEET